MNRIIRTDIPIRMTSIRDFICVRRALRLSKVTLDDIIRYRVLDKLQAGKTLHRFVEFTLPCEREVRTEICGKMVIADAICEDTQGKFVVELKTTLGEIESTLFQLKAYMAALGIDRGVVIGVIDRRMKFIRLSEKELEDFKNELCRRVELYNKGIDVPMRGTWCNSCWFKNECLNSKL